jgi:hypothetical protein
MEEVLSLYAQPYDPKRPLICQDETQKQLVGETQVPLACAPGKPRRYDTHYIRNGVSQVFLAFEPLAGKRVVETSEHRGKNDWAFFIRALVDEHYPQAETIVLVVDNLNIHSKASLYATFSPQEAKRLADKLEIHYTPVHGSWLNMAEIELSRLSKQCLDRRIPSRTLLQREIKAWEHTRNNNNAKIDWRFTVTDARIKLKRLYPSL